MSLYLQITVGAGRYLLDAAHVVEIRPGSRSGDDGVRRQDRAAPVVDLRELFNAAPVAQGHCILCAQADGGPAALIVDRIDGLAEFGAAEWCPLPPIGPLGGLIDAVSLRLADDHPLLRLRGERALAATAVG